VDGDRIQSPKRCVLKYEQKCVLDQNRAVDNVQKHNICTVFMKIDMYIMTPESISTTHS
jgi:hypothetical protein